VAAQTCTCTAACFGGECSQSEAIIQGRVSATGCRGTCSCGLAATCGTAGERPRTQATDITERGNRGPATAGAPTMKAWFFNRHEQICLLAKLRFVVIPQ